MRSLSINRHALVKFVIGLWIFKGAYLYLIWEGRTFSMEALNEGAVNLGRAGLGLGLLSVAFVTLQAVCLFFWWRKGVSNAIAVSPFLALSVLLFGVTSVVGYVVVGGNEFWYYWPIVAYPLMLVAATPRVYELAIFCMRGYGAVLIASIVLAVLYPDRMTMASGDTDLFPWPRLAGLTPHPNALGVTAALVGICAYILSRQKERYFWMAVAIVSLVLAQSKTSMVAFALVLIVDHGGRAFRYMGRQHVQATIVAVVALLAFTSPVWLPGAAAALESGNATLTGRTDIWSAAISMWMKSPVVGFGPDAFDAYFRQVERLSGAESAHNQPLDTLVSSGLVGLFGLAVMLGAWVTRVGHMAEPLTRRLAVGLTLFLCVRCMSESTLKFVGPSATFVVFFLIVALMLSPASQKPFEKSAA